MRSSFEVNAMVLADWCNERNYSVYLLPMVPLFNCKQFSRYSRSVYIQTFFSILASRHLRRGFTLRINHDSVNFKVSLQSQPWKRLKIYDVPLQILHRFLPILLRFLVALFISCNEICARAYNCGRLIKASLSHAVLKQYYVLYRSQNETIEVPFRVCS